MSLYTPVTRLAVTFSKNEQALEFLEREFDSLHIKQQSIPTLRLDFDFKANNLSYTEPVFSYVCSKLCPSLLPTIKALQNDPRPNTPQNESAASTEMARHLFNRMLTLYEDKPAIKNLVLVHDKVNYRLVRDSRLTSRAYSLRSDLFRKWAADLESDRRLNYVTVQDEQICFSVKQSSRNLTRLYMPMNYSALVHHSQLYGGNGITLFPAIELSSVGAMLGPPLTILEEEIDVLRTHVDFCIAQCIAGDKALDKLNTSLMKERLRGFEAFHKFAERLRHAMTLNVGLSNSDINTIVGNAMCEIVGSNENAIGDTLASMSVMDIVKAILITAGQMTDLNDKIRFSRAAYDFVVSE